MLFTALLVAVAMIVQDIFYVLLTQAEARNRAALAGMLDCAAYLASLVTTVVSVTALQGHNFDLKMVVLGAVTAANFVGAFSGVLIGQRLVKELPHGPDMAELRGRPVVDRRSRHLPHRRHAKAPRQSGK